MKIKREKKSQDDESIKLGTEKNTIHTTFQDYNEDEVKVPKRGRGRPPKNKEIKIDDTIEKKSKRGRPRKNITEDEEKVKNIEDDEIFLPIDYEGSDDVLNLEELKSTTPDKNNLDEEDNILPEYEENDNDEDYDDQDYNDEDYDDEDYEDYEDYDDDEDENNVEENNSDLEEDGYEDEEGYSYDGSIQKSQEVDEKDEEFELPGFEEDDDYDDEDDDYDDDEDEYIEDSREYVEPIKNVNFTSIDPKYNSNNLEQTSYRSSHMNVNIDNLLSSDKKIVSFVGTSKNGTSFLINNVAQMLSERGIKTAILDLTQNRNDYYIYTDNREELRNIAYRCIESLRKGIPEGIQVNRNLTIYTSLPDDIEGLNDANLIIKTLLNNYSLVLLDCDFMTDLSYFNISQEIYLVQSLDVLTIQPLTAFLRELKAKNILDSNKLKVVINKYVRNQISPKMIIGGMSSYNDPSMSYMTELFDRDKVKYYTVPFEIQNYSKYLEELVDCKISLKGYSKILMKSLEELVNSVFPLIYNSAGKNQKNYNSYFSNSTNSTLNKMKKKY